jgi:hypothetical protein
MKENWNETHSSRHKKFTVNIPNELYAELERKVKEIDEDFPLGVYFRILIRREVKRQVLIPDDEILRTDPVIKGSQQPSWKFSMRRFIRDVKDRQIIWW